MTLNISQSLEFWEESCEIFIGDPHHFHQQKEADEEHACNDRIHDHDPQDF